MEELNNRLHLYDELAKRGLTIDNLAVLIVCVGFGLVSFGLLVSIAIKGGYLNVRNS